jgi:ornithine cyclodeaminase
MSKSTTAIIALPSILEYLSSVELIPLIEKGFVALSNGDAVVPPVGELLFEKPVGETHIKYGYIKNEPYYVLKVASGFYENPKLGLNSSQGVMLLFSQQTGELLAILLDEGHLTDVRTAIASMITLKYLAPKDVNCLGIIGTGIQAQLQLKFLSQVSNVKNIIIWGRNRDNANLFKSNFSSSDFIIQIAENVEDLARNSNVIITTTSSTEALLFPNYIQPGTHITAIGSDTSEKIELSPQILKNANIVVSDSIAQSFSRGEIFQARKQNYTEDLKIIELGDLIQNPKLGRTNDQQITIADLTGVAVQDIMIATAIFNHHKNL